MFRLASIVLALIVFGHIAPSLAGASVASGYSLSQTLNARQLPEVLKTTRSGGANAVWLSYTYDARRKITNVDDLDGQGANESRVYGYDANGRLTSASGPWGSGGANATGSFTDYGAITVTVHLFGITVTVHLIDLGRSTW